MNNSLIIVLLIFVALSLLRILSGQTVFQHSKGSTENLFRQYKKTRAIELREMRKEKENRQHPRGIVNWSVTINSAQGSIGGKTRDVSATGAFIYCDKPLPPRHVFCLSLHIHSSTVSLTSTAESVWSTHKGMGVRFHYDNPEQGHLLSKFILDA
jgi:hypothetical protein